jgi:NitT/TauT family transport system substrate-binding protein
MRGRWAALFTVMLASGGLVAGAADLLPVRVGSGVTDTYAEVSYGEQAGFLKAAGLDATLVVPANSAAIAAAVAGGSIDIGIGSLVSIAQGHAAGLPYRCIAPAALYNSAAPTTLLMVANESPLRSPHDLQGKVVGVDSLRGQPEVSMTAWLEKNGMSPQSVRYTEIPFATMGAALQSGRIDAAIVAEPALTSIRATARVFADPYAAIGATWYINCWFSTTSWIAQNPDTVRAFRTAVAHTAAWANDHQDATLSVLEQIARVTPDVGTKMTRGRFSDQPLDPALMQPLLDAAYKAGLLKSTVAARDVMAAP